MGHHLMTAENYFNEIFYGKGSMFSHPHLGMHTSYKKQGMTQWKVQCLGIIQSHQTLFMTFPPFPTSEKSRSAQIGHVSTLSSQMGMVWQSREWIESKRSYNEFPSAFTK